MFDLTHATVWRTEDDDDSFLLLQWKPTYSPTLPSPWLSTHNPKEKTHLNSSIRFYQAHTFQYEFQDTLHPPRHLWHHRPARCPRYASRLNHDHVRRHFRHPDNHHDDLCCNRHSHCHRLSRHNEPQLRLHRQLCKHEFQRHHVCLQQRHFQRHGRYDVFDELGHGICHGQMQQLLDLCGLLRLCQCSSYEDQW